MSPELHVVFGTGPVGCWIARALREMDKPVRAVNRSGARPQLMPAEVEVVAADVSDAAQAIDAARGATTVYQAVNAPYHRWHELFPPLQAGAMAAAKAVGARYVSIENLYMYDSSQSIREDSPFRPRSKKGELRARLANEVMTAHERGEIRATALRSSDYYGPGVLQSALGERVFANLVAGKKAQVTASADTPHSWAYIEDVGRAAAVLGTRDEALGRAWIAPHAPPCTAGDVVARAANALDIDPQLMIISRRMMQLVGLFNPDARAAVEMLYLFQEPFVVDSARIQDAFDLQPTPIDVGVERTVRWFQDFSQKHA
ncbi:MAG: NAD(P)H-binding protein [Chloroflexi bacterium]|nr:NAD(P)H-binding protein [Chloroflexota bacterium]